MAGIVQLLVIRLSRPDPRRWLSALAAFYLLGCTHSYYLRDLRGEYQPVDLPTNFGDTAKGVRFTGYAAFNRQKEIAYGVDTALWVEETNRLYGGNVTIDRGPALLGGSATLHGRLLFAGFAFGIPPQNADLAQAGLFAGISPVLGHWSPMISIGAFINRVHSRLDYLDYVQEGPEPPVITEDTLDRGSRDFSLPIKAGLRYRTGPFGAYAIAGRTGTGFWPGLRKENIPLNIETRETSLGLVWYMNTRISFAGESGREWTECGDKYAASAWRGKVYLIADYR